LHVNKYVIVYHKTFVCPFRFCFIVYVLITTENQPKSTTHFGITMLS